MIKLFVIGDSAANNSGSSSKERLIERAT